MSDWNEYLRNNTGPYSLYGRSSPLQPREIPFGVSAREWMIDQARPSVRLQRKMDEMFPALPEYDILNRRW